MILRKFLPKKLSVKLFGDRARWGLEPIISDRCWIDWQRTYAEFYSKNQRSGIGLLVNDAGYSVMSGINLTGKRVLEVGAGDIRHIKYWQGCPSEYFLADVSENMMVLAKKCLEKREIPYQSFLVNRKE